jgi:hypothetical protein
MSASPAIRETTEGFAVNVLPVGRNLVRGKFDRAQDERVRRIGRIHLDDKIRHAVWATLCHSSGALRNSFMLRIAMALSAPPVIT